MINISNYRRIVAFERYFSTSKILRSLVLKRQNNKASEIIDRTLPDELTTLGLKIVPEVLKVSLKHAYDGSIVAHFYRVNCEYSGNETGSRLRHSALNNLGFITTTKLPIRNEDVTLGGLSRPNDMQLSFSYLEEKSLTTDELATMQSFHRSAMCLEIPKLPSDTLSTAETHGFVTWDQVSSIHTYLVMEPAYVSFDDWRASSKGAWFVCFPLHPESKGYDAAYTEQAAKESIALVHNLHRIHTLPVEKRKLISSWFNSKLPSCNKAELVFTSSGNDIFRLFPESDSAAKYTLDSFAPSTTVPFAKRFVSTPQRQIFIKEQLTNTDHPHHLSHGEYLSGKLTLLNPWRANHPYLQSKDNKHPQLFIPEFCLPIGKLQWLNTMLLLPAVTFRLQATLLADELRSKVFAGIETQEQPSLSLMLEAMTSTRCQENMTQERLEFLGDTFLKMAASVHVFLTRADDDEGRLTDARIEIISNANLIEKARMHDLSKYTRAVPVSKGLEELQYVPPGHLLRKCSLRNVNVQKITTTATATNDVVVTSIVSSFPANLANDDDTAMIVVDDSSDMAMANGESKGAASAVHVQDDQQLHIVYDIRNKVQSDLLEALLGAACVSGGVELGFRTLPRLGILPEQAADLSMIQAKAASYIKVVEAALSQPNILTLTIERQKELEDKLLYRFRHPLLLSLAMRHPSLQQGGGSWSYQRLEFLGDAVLDLVVVSTLFKLYPDATVGTYFSMKRDLTNNDYLVQSTMKLYLMRYLLHNSAHLKNFQDIHEKLILVKLQVPIVNTIVWAQVFEAVIGAVYLDSGCNLGTVEQLLKDIGYLHRVKMGSSIKSG